MRLFNRPAQPQASANHTTNAQETFVQSAQPQRKVRQRKPRYAFNMAPIIYAFLKDNGLAPAGSGKPGFKVEQIGDAMVKVTHVQNNADSAEQREQLKIYKALLGNPLTRLNVRERTALNEPRHLVVSAPELVKRAKHK